MEDKELIPHMLVYHEQIGVGIVLETKEDTALVTFIGVAPNAWVKTSALDIVDMGEIRIEYAKFLIAVRKQLGKED